MWKPRTLSPVIQELVRYFPVVVVTGPRQVGKSSLLANLFGATHEHIVFDPVIDIRGARADPELFVRTLPERVILDEIQYVPQLISPLKRHIDANRVPGNYLITGSQQWEVMKSLSESLAGRAVFVELHGFSAAEAIGQGTDAPWIARFLEDAESFVATLPKFTPYGVSPFDYVWRGGLPEAHALPPHLVPTFLAGYVRTYIERDVRMLVAAQDWSLFERFFRLAGALTAQEMNLSQFGRELGLARQTCQRWLSVLKATFQWREIPAFEGNAVKRVSEKPKGYLTDSGLAAYGQSISSPVTLSGHPMFGSMFEGLVVGEVVKAIGVLSPAPQLYHWRRHSGAEVDLVLERDGILYPIEIKSKSTPSRRDVQGLQAFREAFKGRKIGPGLVIAPTADAYHLSDNDIVVPWDLRVTVKP
jgi:hypothetical protein